MSVCYSMGSQNLLWLLRWVGETFLRITNVSRPLLSHGHFFVCVCVCVCDRFLCESKRVQYEATALPLLRQQNGHATAIKQTKIKSVLCLTNNLANFWYSSGLRSPRAMPWFKAEQITADRTEADQRPYNWCRTNLHPLWLMLRSTPSVWQHARASADRSEACEYGATPR